jgi:multicomponent Na+:H+ antiporter subunit E
VARRAFDPHLPLRPGWLIRDVALSAGGRVALGAELSLMPGTLVAGSDGRALLVHVLDTGDDHEQALATEEARLVAVMGRGEE